MRVCPKCGRENPEDRDFCECGEYLRWEQTTVRPRVDRTQQPAPVPAASPQDAVVLTLRLPDGVGRMTPAGARIDLTPGTQATLYVHLRNQSEIVDNYAVGVRGLPADWWTVSPAVVYLVPYGSEGGSYEQDLQLQLHPPPGSPGRPYDFEVVVSSRAHSAVVAAARATVVLPPEPRAEAVVAPPPPLPPPPPRRRGPWWVWVIIALILLFAIAIAAGSGEGNGNGGGTDTGSSTDTGGGDGGGSGIPGVITNGPANVRAAPDHAGQTVGSLEVGTPVVVECFTQDQNTTTRWFQLVEPEPGTYVGGGLISDNELDPPEC